MKYDFPVIKNANDLWTGVFDGNENTKFVLVDHNWFVTYNYVTAKPNDFKNEFHRECRGIAFDKETGDIISRPYHKFFHVNESEETHIDNIDMSDEHVIFDKMSGYMIYPIFSIKKNGFRLASKAGINDVSMRAEVLISTYSKYFKLLRWCEENNLTPIFDFDEKNLVVTGIRDRFEGRYISYNEMYSVCMKFHIPVTPHKGKIDNIKDFMQYNADSKNDFIVRKETGHMFKIRMGCER